MNFTLKILAAFLLLIDVSLTREKESGKTCAEGETCPATNEDEITHGSVNLYSKGEQHMNGNNQTFVLI